jgi:UDP-N-acetylglucosamine/UDP-N-acetylgalactosamine diphosphorylase
MSNLSLAERFAHAAAMLEKVDQKHLLHAYDHLDNASRERLLGQIEQQDWEQIDRLIDSHVKQEPRIELPEKIEPAPYYPNLPTNGSMQARYVEARRIGEQLIRGGKVAAFVVAGGQGTRLGWDAPKGTYPATPLLGKPLFQVFAEYIRNVQQKYQATVPFYIMTSPSNDGPTRAFFREHNHFNLDPADIIFFQQGTMPSFSPDGKVLMTGRDSLALNPDGHGGSLRAMFRSGALEDMKQRGIEQISYFQVDNPNVKCIDPLFIGLHALDEAEMSSKMIPKTDPFEKVGNFCLVDGKVTVIEYSDLPDELAEARTGEGNLKFVAGSIAIHVIAMDFVERLNEGGFGLPWHRADKKVAHLDIDSGEWIEPSEPNAVKLETFVFDALPLCRTSIIYETERLEDFAPIKNATGVDSAETSKQLQSQRAAKWLEQVGVEVPRDESGQVRAQIELSHLTAVEPDDLRHADLPKKIEPDSKVLL